MRNSHLGLIVAVGALALGGCATTTSTPTDDTRGVAEVEGLLRDRYGMGDCDVLGGGSFRCVIGYQTYVDVTCLPDGSCSTVESWSDAPIESDPYATP